MRLNLFEMLKHSSSTTQLFDNQFSAWHNSNEQVEYTCLYATIDVQNVHKDAKLGKRNENVWREQRKSNKERQTCVQNQIGRTLCCE